METHPRQYDFFYVTNSSYFEATNLSASSTSAETLNPNANSMKGPSIWFMLSGSPAPTCDAQRRKRIYTLVITKRTWLLISAQ